MKKKFVLKAMVITALRKTFRKWPPYAQVLNQNKKEYFIDTKKGTKARRVHFCCNICKKYDIRKNVSVDHISPVIHPNDGFIDYNTYVERLFCNIDNLQILCQSCHDVKTKQENKLRKVQKYLNKTGVDLPPPQKQEKKSKKQKKPIRKKSSRISRRRKNRQYT